MITKDDIIAMVRNVTKQSQGRRARRILHPVRDWCIGLLSAACIFIAVSIYAGWLFFTETHKNVDGHTVHVETVTYDHERVERVLETYHAKARRFAELGSLEFEPLPEASGDADDDASLRTPLEVE